MQQTNAASFGTVLRRLREAKAAEDARFSLCQGAPRCGVMPACPSRVERDDVPPPSEETLLRLAADLGADPDVMLAMAGKVSADLRAAIIARPQLFAELVRAIRTMPDTAVLRLVREVRDGDWSICDRQEGPMPTLEDDDLIFRFPDIDPEASLAIGFQRTLRIPDSGRDYPLPPGFGRFPLRHVEDHAARLPADTVRRGGVILPMGRAEALWIDFSGGYGREFPVAVMIAAGKVKAVTGEAAPTHPPSAQDHAKAGLPWFEHDGRGALPGGRLGRVRSVGALHNARTGAPLPGAEDVAVQQVLPFGPGAPRPVRDGDRDR